MGVPSRACERPKIGQNWPKSLQKRFKTLQEPPRGARQERPKSPKRAPRGAKKRQEAPRRAGEQFWSHFVTPGTPRNCKPCKHQGKSRFSPFPRALKKKPKLQNEPPGGQNEPQERPGRSQERPKERPKRRPEQPGAPQEGTKRAPREALGAQSPPRGLQEPIVASFWGARGFMFKQFRRPFRSSRALRQTIESTLRNHWSKGLVFVWPRFGGQKT